MFNKPLIVMFLFLTAGYMIPKDTAVNVWSWCLHYDPRVYPEIHKFDPSRFSADNCAHRHPYAYVPFSAGPRNCIGKLYLKSHDTIIHHASFWFFIIDLFSGSSWSATAKFHENRGAYLCTVHYHVTIIGFKSDSSDL